MAVIKTEKKNNFKWVSVAFALAIGLVPSIALAEPWGFFDGLNAFFLSNVARSIAVFVCIILGILMWLGKLDKEIALKFIGGIIVIWGGAAIVDVLIGFLD